MDSNLRRQLTHLGRFPELQHHTDFVLLFLFEKNPIPSPSTLFEAVFQFPELHPHIQPLLEVSGPLKKKEYVLEYLPPHTPEQCIDVLRPVLDTIVNTLAPIPFLNTQEICVAGGAVRDLLVGRVPKDIDVFVPIKDTIGPLTSGIGENPSFIVDILQSVFEQSRGKIPLMNWYGNAKMCQLFTEKWGSQISTLQDALNCFVPTLFLLLEIPNLCPTFPEIHTQVIFQTSFSTAMEVLNHFDLDISEYGITMDGMIQSSKAPSIENLMLKADGKLPVEMYSYWGIRVDHRIQSFEKRGWDMGKAREFVKNNPALCPDTAPHLTFY